MAQCDGCGYCCTVEPCIISCGYHGKPEGPCPSLVREGKRFRCGLIESAWEISPEFAATLEAALDIGKGCGCQDERVLFKLGREMRRLDGGT